jgi:TolB-like protein/DNA-binding winged helix-turn-helix (wHTH) protein
MLRMGDWCVNPKSGQISRDGDTTQLEERAMRLLLCLAGRPGEVVSIDDLLTQAWSGVTVSQDSVYQAVATLRRQLGDDSKKPAYIATVPRLGYRMVARQCRRTPRRLRSVDIRPASRGRPERCFASRFVFRADAPAIARQPQKSIAVLPFLDLTEQMNQEPFADGMTEELIDKFSKIPGLRVPPPTSSFYFKGKQIPVADIAKTLGVAYILDGSVRKSGATLRVAARLIRADNGFVVWSETYDRPLNDILMVQDDIAGEVTKALRASIEARPAAR